MKPKKPKGFGKFDALMRKLVRVKPARRGPKYRCQFCGYEGAGWLKGDECPKCHKAYDAAAAQEGDD